MDEKINVGFGFNGSLVLPASAYSPELFNGKLIVKGLENLPRDKHGNPVISYDCVVSGLLESYKDMRIAHNKIKSAR